MLAMLALSPGDGCKLLQGFNDPSGLVPLKAAQLPATEERRESKCNMRQFVVNYLVVKNNGVCREL
jgi:hypothetical protein